VLWGPTPAFRNVLLILVFAGLLALGVTMLRQQTALEFPNAQHGEALRRMRTGRRRAEPAASGRVDELERLAGLHDRGVLTDEEFAAEKAHLVGSQP
jgi:hypothetical protein